MKRVVKNTNLITIGENGRGNVFMGVYITKKNNRKKYKSDFETAARFVTVSAKSFSDCC
jgi:hypothetical protein